MREALLSWDHSLFRLLNHSQGAGYDTLMELLGTRWLWLPLYFVLIFFLSRKLSARSLLLFLFGVALLILLSDQLSSSLIKPLMGRYRPCNAASFFKGEVHMLSEYCGSAYGFVSSHAANFMALASVFLFSFFREYKWPALLLLAVALLTGYQRIYAGVHYPTDVAGGYLLGFFLGAVAGWTFRRWGLQYREAGA